MGSGQPLSRRNMPEVAQEPAQPECLCPEFLHQAMPSASFLTLVPERKLAMSGMGLHDVA